MTGKTIVIDLKVVGTIFLLTCFVAYVALAITGPAGLWDPQHEVIYAELPTLQSDGSELTYMLIRTTPGPCWQLFGYGEEKVIRHETTSFPSGWKSTDPEHSDLSVIEAANFYGEGLQKSHPITTFAPTEEVQPEEPQVAPIETPTVFEEARLLQKTLQEIFHLQGWVYVRQIQPNSLESFMVIYHRDTALKLGDLGYLREWCGKTILYRWSNLNDEQEDF